MILALLRILLSCFIAFLIIIFLVYLIVLFGTFCKWCFAYRQIKELYGREKSYRKSQMLGTQVYNNYVHVSFKKLLKFYNVSPEKYEIKDSINYNGICYLTRADKPNPFENLSYPCVREVYYFIMDTFSDFLKYQKFCKSIDKQREQEERRKEEQQDLQQSDSALADYVKLVKADIAENEEQLNKKIQELKDELEKQKKMLGE